MSTFTGNLAALIVFAASYSVAQSGNPVLFQTSLGHPPQHSNPGTVTPKQVMVDPAGRFVYAADGDGVWAYALNAVHRELQAVPQSPLQTPGGYQIAMAIHPSGRFLYSLNSTWGFIFPRADSISLYGINPF